MRKTIRRSSGRPALRSTMAFCTSMAQRTASSTLRNSTSAPSPVRFMTRPLCTEIVGSMRSLRSARRRASVRSSSAPVIRLNQTTSAARIAASLRVAVIRPSAAAQPSTTIPPVVTRKMVDVFRRESEGTRPHDGPQVPSEAMRIKSGRRGDAKLSQVARAASIARLSRHLRQKSSAEPREAGRRMVTGANTSRPETERVVISEGCELRSEFPGADWRTRP